MIDYGLLLSLIIGFGAPALLAQWWPLSTFEPDDGFIDAVVGPAFAGLAVGRLTTLALDDPSSIGNISDMIIIRSGVEFWPGLAAAITVVLWGARRSGVPPLARLADLIPLSMVGYAGYEFACLFRDGCFGPDSPVGLRPKGLSSTMLPVGWIVAAAIAVCAIGIRGLSARNHPRSVVVLAGVAIVASTRAVASIWLPHVGDGLTRQHLVSIGVAIAAAVSLLVTVAVRGRSVQTPLSMRGG